MSVLTQLEIQNENDKCKFEIHEDSCSIYSNHTDDFQYIFCEKNQNKTMFRYIDHEFNNKLEFSDINIICCSDDSSETGEISAVLLKPIEIEMDYSVDDDAINIFNLVVIISVAISLGIFIIVLIILIYKKSKEWININNLV